jgi:hypothetical protein
VTQGRRIPIPWRILSGFILNAVFNRIQMRDKLTADTRDFLLGNC